MRELDKAEYRIKLEQINALAEEGDFRGAAEVADEIDWRHVKSARTLCMIGEIYEANKRYEDSCRILKYAYRRSASSKTVLYRLAELDIRTGNYEEAKKFINEFESNSPGDSSRFLLKYKLLRATKAPLDDQIAVLKDYKDAEYTERWAYELAKLYKRNGQKEKCVEECDDMILWFAEGKYVTKAMELKMSLTSLTPAQQARYESQRHRAEQEESAAEKPAEEEEQPSYTAMENVEKTILAADDEEEEVHTEVSATEAIEKMDHAAGRFNAGEIKPRNEEKTGPSRLQDRLTSSIRNIFSGMLLERDEEGTEDEDIKIAEEPGRAAEAAAEPEEAAEAPAPEMPAEEEPEDDPLAEAFAFARQSVEEQKGAAEATAESPDEETADLPEEPRDAEGDSDVLPEEEGKPEAPAKQEEALPMKDGEVDFEKLFAMSASALAGEVASGNYVMADTLEEDREEAEAAAELARKGAEGTEEADEEAEAAKREADLIGRETDESLGLTREFSFREEIRREIAKQSEEKTPITSPEEAARRTVLEETEEAEDAAPGTEAAEPSVEGKEAAGAPGDAAGSEKAAEGEADELEIPEEAEDADENLMAAFSGEAEEIEIPEEEHETLMGLAGIEHEAAAEASESETMIEDVMGESGVFTIQPVEGRELTGPEKTALSYFANIPGIDRQTTAALADIHNNCGDKTSRSGNVIIMGRQGSGKTRLADGLILMTCLHLGLKAAKVAKIVAQDLNQKDPAAVVKKLSGGFLVIEGAGALADETVNRLNQAMEFRTDDMIVILEDEREDLKKVLEAHADFAEKFTSRITVPVFTNDELVTFARVYAAEEGYKFDELSTLALYTIIGDQQRGGEPVTVGRVREILDKAIDRNHRRLFGKVTDRADGKTVLVEKDFNF